MTAPWTWVVRVGAVLCVMLGILAAFQATGLRTDNAIERWLNPDSPETRDYERFLETFGDDEFVVLALSGKPLFEPDALDVMLLALENMESVPHVNRVTGIPSVYRDHFGAEDPEALEVEFTSTPFYEGLLISRDHEIAGLFFEMDPPLDAAGRRELMENVQRAAQPLADYGFRLDYVGPPALNVVLDKVSERETLRAMPLAFGCSIVVLALLLRSGRATLAATICGTLSVVLPMGLIAWMDRPLTMVSSVLPPLLWVLSLSHSVHIVTRYQHHRSSAQDPSAAMAAALRETVLPCILSAVTTAAGFFSLSFSTMPPIREMGRFAALGLLIALVVSLTLIPVLLPLLRVPPRRSARSIWLPLLRLAEGTAERHPAVAAAVFVVIMAAGLFSVFRIQAEPNPLAFLPEDSPTVGSYNFVSSHLTGLYSIEVVVDCPDGWLSPAYWAALDALSADTEQSPSVARVLSPLDLLKKANQWDHDLDPAWYVLPETRESAESLLREMDDVGTAELARLVSDDGKRIRLSILPTVMDAKRFYELADRVQERLDALPGNLSAHFTGIVILLNNAQVDLAMTQLKSFAFAFIVVFLIIGIGLRSLPLMLLSIPPNVTPTLAVFALMPLLEIPLDAGTVLVAGVALGISVDNTIHLLAAFRRIRPVSRGARSAVGRALDEVGPPMIYSTLTSIIGFATLWTSGFVPIRYFGLLSVIALFVALAADLVLTPSILVLRNGRNGR
jgi:predicted RND superfamily exporter protein